MFRHYFKQSKFSRHPSINGTYVSILKSSNIKAAQINEDLDRLTKGKEAIRMETIGLLEDKFVHEAIKAKGG